MYDPTDNSNKIPNNLPPRLSDFTNRIQEFEELDGFVGNRNGRRHIVVWGEGGIGKTSLILEYVHRLVQMERVDAAVWTSYKRYELGAPKVTLRAPYLMNVDDSYSKKGRDIWVDSFEEFLLKVMQVSQHPNAEAFLSEPPTRQEVVDWLCMKRVVVTVDDLDSWEDWLQYVNLANQVRSSASIFIISSRQLFDISRYPELASLKVGPISSRESNRFLMNLLKDRQFDLTPSEQHQLIEFADGNPLLMRLSVALIENKVKQLTIGKLFGRRSQVPISDLLQRFRGQPSEKFLVDDIYRSLSPNAREVVLVLAVLNGMFPNRSVAAQLRELVDLPRPELDRTLRELESSSLVNRKGKDRDPHDMHEVVRDLILQKDRFAAEEVTKRATELFLQG